MAIIQLKNQIIMCTGNRECGLGDIYKITCKVNNRIYIGQGDHWIKGGEDRPTQASGYMGRFKNHFSVARYKASKTGGKIVKTTGNSKSDFYSDCVEYGEDNFTIECLGTYPIDQLDTKETESISEHRNLYGELVYNIAKGGNNIGRDVLIGNDASVLMVANRADLYNQAAHLVAKKKIKTSGLPMWVNAIKSSGKATKGQIIGYKVRIEKDGQNNDKICSASTHKTFTLEQRLEESIKYRDAMYERLFGRPISQLFEMMEIIESKKR